MARDWWIGIVVVSIGCGRTPVPQTAEIQPVLVSPTAAATALPKPVFGPTDWPGWRGPQNDGIAQGTGLPVSWSETSNVVWKTKIPGHGHSSPIIIGDRIFLETADDGAQSQSVMAIDRKTGKWLWQTEILTGNFEQAMHAENSHASSTLACDGERLFATFLNDRRIYCSSISFDGEELWRQEVGGFLSRFGFSGSPVVYEGLVILAADHEDGGFIAGLDRATGNIVWRRKRPKNASYASPRVVTLNGKDQVVLCGCKLVTSYDPLTGAENWTVEGTTESTVGTAVVSENRVIVSGGYPGAETLAIEGDGKVAWRVKDKCYVPSLLAADGLIYLVQDDGVAKCLDASNGSLKWKHRIGGKFRTSPLWAGGNIYVTDMSGKTTIFKAQGSKFELVAENVLGTEGFASPAVSGQQLFLRVASDASGLRQEWLYCLAQMTEPAIELK